MNAILKNWALSKYLKKIEDNLKKRKEWSLLL